MRESRAQPDPQQRQLREESRIPTRESGVGHLGLNDLPRPSERARPLAHMPVRARNASVDRSTIPARHFSATVGYHGLLLVLGFAGGVSPRCGASRRHPHDRSAVHEPIFYPAARLPESLRACVLLNSLTFVIEQTRGVLIRGEFPNWVGLAAYLGLSVVVAWLGLFWFQRTRHGFADVI